MAPDGVGGRYSLGSAQDLSKDTALSSTTNRQANIVTAREGSDMKWRRLAPPFPLVNRRTEGPDYRALNQRTGGTGDPLSGICKVMDSAGPSGPTLAAILSPVFSFPEAPSILVSEVTRSRTSWPDISLTTSSSPSQ